MLSRRLRVGHLSEHRGERRITGRANLPFTLSEAGCGDIHTDELLAAWSEVDGVRASAAVPLHNASQRPVVLHRPGELLVHNEVLFADRKPGIVTGKSATIAPVRIPSLPPI